MMTSVVPTFLEGLGIDLAAPGHPPGTTAGQTSPMIVRNDVAIGPLLERVGGFFAAGRLGLFRPDQIEPGRLGLVVFPLAEFTRWLEGFRATEEWLADDWFGFALIQGDQVVLYPDDRRPGATIQVCGFTRIESVTYAHRVVIAEAVPAGAPSTACRDIVAIDVTAERCASGHCDGGLCMPRYSSHDGRTGATACWCQ